ncbi:hypothetical protein [Cohnella pontilimi]|nr:hypothetical protein [Cohnella pontilimi]
MEPNETEPVIEQENMAASEGEENVEQETEEYVHIEWAGYI